jgi:hypothetical protein
MASTTTSSQQRIAAKIPKTKLKQYIQPNYDACQENGDERGMQK